MLTTPSEGRRIGEARLVGLTVFFVSCFCLMAVSFWLLQVVQHQKYKEIASNQHLRTIPLRAPRGLVFDRAGVVLVENQLSFTIAVVREQMRDLEATIRGLAEATGVDPARIRDVMQRRRREPLFRPISVIEHATFAQVAAVRARRREMPELVVQQVPTRTYPTDQLGAHMFGYVGEVQESQLQRAEYSALEPGAIIGQTGLERIYNERLMGTDGNRFVVVNSTGREIEELEKEDPVEGARLQLTVDYDLQRALEDGFRVKDYGGAAVILDPRTGEILAMTSLPAYDPNKFAVGIESAEWARLIADPLKPMNNRLIQGTYSPGSTFKMVMAIAGLQEKVITPETHFFCPGYGTFYGHRFKCWKPGGHGSVEVRRAIEQSCNVFFYNVGDRLGVDRINKYARALGLVGKTGVDLPGEVESLVPSTEWKMRTFKGQDSKWYAGETISVSIGQGAVTVTPIGLGTMVATIANGGTLLTPHLVRAVDRGDGKGWQMLPVPAPRSTLSILPENLQAVRDGMWSAVNGSGTAGRARIVGYDVAGKTGTSQVIGNENKALAAGRGMEVRDNGWFVFFAPRDNPQIAGAVFVERGEHGGDAAPIARHVMDTFFAKKESRPLPPSPLLAAKAVVIAASPAPAAVPTGASSSPRGAGAPAPTAPAGRTVPPSPRPAGGGLRDR